MDGFLFDRSPKSSITAVNIETPSVKDSSNDPALLGVVCQQDEAIPADNDETKLSRGVEPQSKLSVQPHHESKPVGGYAWALSLYFDEADTELEATQDTEVKLKVQIEEPSTQPTPAIRSKVKIQEIPSRDAGEEVNTGAKQDMVARGSSVWSLVSYYLDEVEQEIEQERTSTSDILAEDTSPPIPDPANSFRYDTNCGQPISHAEPVEVPAAPSPSSESKRGLPTDNSPVTNDYSDLFRYEANRNWKGCDGTGAGVLVGHERREVATVVASNINEDKQEAGPRPEGLPSDSPRPAVPVVADPLHDHTNNNWTGGEGNTVGERGAGAHREARPAIVFSGVRSEQSTKHGRPTDRTSLTVADLCDPFRYDTNSDQMSLTNTSAGNQDWDTSQETPSFSSGPGPFCVAEDQGSKGPPRSFSFEAAMLPVEDENKPNYVGLLSHTNSADSVFTGPCPKSSTKRGPPIFGSNVHSKNSLPLRIRVPSDRLQANRSQAQDVPQLNLAAVQQALLSPPLTPGKSTPLRGILKKEKKAQNQELPSQHTIAVPNSCSHPVRGTPHYSTPNPVPARREDRRSSSSTASGRSKRREPVTSFIFRSEPPPVPVLPSPLLPNTSSHTDLLTPSLTSMSPMAPRTRLSTPPESPRTQLNPTATPPPISAMKPRRTPIQLPSAMANPNRINSIPIATEYML